jgi:hypothetical protein
MSNIDFPHELRQFASELGSAGDEVGEALISGAVDWAERLTAENARLVAEVDRLTLRWSSDPPKVPGIYLFLGHWANEYYEPVVVYEDLWIHGWNEDSRIVGPLVVQEPATRGEVNHD